MEIYYYLFLIVGLIALSSYSVNKKVVTIVISIILILFAGTRLDIDEDYHMYFKNFQYVENSVKKFQTRDIPIEWCVYVLPHFFALFLTKKLAIVRATFLIFAFLGVSIKLIAIKKYANIFFLSIILYISNLFLMQEMTTIRAGIASAIFLWSIGDIEEKNYKTFFAKIFTSFFFHSSSIVFIIVWVLLKVKIKIQYLYIAIIISLASALFKINILTVLFLDKIFPRVGVYIKMMEWMKEDDTNIYNFRILFALALVITFGLFYKKLQEIKYFDILFRIHIISICIFFLLSTSAQVFSIRTFELLAITQILLYPMIVHIFNPKSKYIGWIIIIAFSLLQIIYLIDLVDIYKPYKSWFFK